MKRMALRDGGTSRVERKRQEKNRVDVAASSPEIHGSGWRMRRVETNFGLASLRPPALLASST
jgi:hypothetical protein